MATSIWKYPLDVQGTQIVEMPKGAKILCVQTQNEISCLWALVTPDSPKEPRTIRTLGTGHPVVFDQRKKGDHEGLYIGTYQIDQGTLVFHVFEEVPTA